MKNKALQSKESPNIWLGCKSEGVAFEYLQEEMERGGKNKLKHKFSDNYQQSVTIVLR